jgi:hypothetical protein
VLALTQLGHLAKNTTGDACFMKHSANKAPMQISEGSWLAQTHQKGAKGLLKGKGKALLNLSLQSDTHAGLLRDEG